MHLLHVVDALQFTKSMLEDVLFPMARKMERLVRGGHASQILKGRVMGSAYFAPSVRTHLSFEAAMHRLGGSTIDYTALAGCSPAASGESPADIVRTLGSYTDAVVLRHSSVQLMDRMPEFSTVPIISAGDELRHPTQALGDAHTIQQEIEAVDGIAIAFVGDLRDRSARSLCYLLPQFSNVCVFFVAPERVRMGSDVKAHLDAHGVHWEEAPSVQDVASCVDVIYQTRIGRDIFFGDMGSYHANRHRFGVGAGVLDCMKDSAIIMHPLPREDEIADQVVDRDLRAVYFSRQLQNGMYVRMALLVMLMMPNADFLRR